MPAVPINALMGDQPNEKLHLDTDAYLVKRCQEGNKQSFQQLYQRHQQRVRSTLYQLCGTSYLDDLVQEVFLRAWKGLPKLRETAHFSTWLYRISWNVASDRRRQFAVETRNFASLQQSATNAFPSQQASPDLMHIHYEDLVQRGLQQLSFDHRAVLVSARLRRRSAKRDRNYLVNSSWHSKISPLSC